MIEKILIIFGLCTLLLINGVNAEQIDGHNDVWILTSSTPTPAVENTSCIIMRGYTSVPANVYFKYGHITNTGFSSSTLNKSVPAGEYTETRCDPPLFPGQTYKYQNCTIEGVCGATRSSTMPTLSPHAVTTFSQYGEAFISNGGDPGWIAMHIWDVYSMVWGSYFLLLLIAFIFMNITIKQKSVTISLLLVLISGATLWTLAPVQLQNIAEILVALALAGLVFWIYKSRR